MARLEIVSWVRSKEELVNYSDEELVNYSDEVGGGGLAGNWTLLLGNEGIDFLGGERLGSVF